MKKFLAVYTGTPSSMKKAGWDSLEESERRQRQKAGMDAWKHWVETNQDRIVDMGGPLGKTKQISGQGIADISNNIAAYVIVQAESHEVAAQLFENHPHFMIFPGDSVEIMECLPIPEV
jgi:hypothetical protein